MRPVKIFSPPATQQRRLPCQALLPNRRRSQSSSRRATRNFLLQRCQSSSRCWCESYIADCDARIYIRRSEIDAVWASFDCNKIGSPAFKGISPSRRTTKKEKNPRERRGRTFFIFPTATPPSARTAGAIARWPGALPGHTMEDPSFTRPREITHHSTMAASSYSHSAE